MLDCYRLIHPHFRREIMAQADLDAVSQMATATEAVSQLANVTPPAYCSDYIKFLSAGGSFRTDPPPLVPISPMITSFITGDIPVVEKGP